jgi:hypothetical protein
VDRLTSASFEAFDGPYKDRTPAPRISSYEQSPALALGTVFVRAAKPSKTCDSTSAADFEYLRLVDHRKSGCKPESFPNRTLTSKKVQGGASVDLQYVVGALATDAKYAFELFISEPSTAVMKSVADCLDESQIGKVQLPDRVCTVQYIAGAVLTQIGYRTYFEYAGDVKAAFGLVKIGGKVYGNETNIDNRYFMTVDTVELSQFFDRSPQGFLTTRKAGPRIKSILTEGELKALTNPARERQILTEQEMADKERR